MKVMVFGSSGFTGEELLKILSKRKGLDIICPTRQEMDGIIKWKKSIPGAEVAFLALPAEQSMELAPKLLERGIRVIDLSGAFRLKNVNDYKKWYGFIHLYPSLLKEAIYGLPEKNRELIQDAKLIANPGCYAAAIELGLLPFVKSGLISSLAEIKIKAISGYTGAGKKAKIPDGVMAYNGELQHRHIPEIEQETGIKNLLFYPHIAFWPRGIMSTIKVNGLPRGILIDIFNLYKDFYKNEFFARVKENVNLLQVIGTNFCDICPEIANASSMIIQVMIDNLGKGAAGQAIQNFNIMFGFPEKLIY